MTAAIFAALILLGVPATHFAGRAVERRADNRTTNRRQQ